MRDGSWDVIIVGAGPAGLSAALVLGRCCRSVLLCDRGTPRSWASKEMHAFVTRDGVPPSDFRRLAFAELVNYPNVSFWQGEVKRASRNSAGFRVHLARRTVHARKLLLATGVFDQLPAIPGFTELFGTSVFPCPYCDGWEYRGRAVAVYGKRRRGFEMARALTAWTRDIVLCTDGPAGLDAQAKKHLERNGVEVLPERIERLAIKGGRLKDVVFRSGRRISRAAVFFDTRSQLQSSLMEQLGCSFERGGRVKSGKYEATTVPGVYAAGNVIQDVQLSIIAAAEGARAAFGINRALTREDFERAATGRKRIGHPRAEDRRS